MSAVTYQSSQTKSGNSASSLAIDKPTSLAVGDLLLAQLVSKDGVTAGVISAPAGWTQISQTNNSNTSFAAFYKVASSSDAAASTFTFSWDASQDVLFGELSRFTGNDTTSPVDQISTASSTSCSGITPTKAMGSFVIMQSGVIFANATGSVSSYAITTNNPSWTEAYDARNQGVLGTAGCAMAYGGSNTLTATGTASTAVVGYVDGLKIYLINIVPAPLTPLSLSATLAIPSVRVILNAGLAVLASIVSPTFREVVPTIRNVAKSAAAAWTNLSKS